MVRLWEPSKSMFVPLFHFCGEAEETFSCLSYTLACETCMHHLPGQWFSPLMAHLSQPTFRTVCRTAEEKGCVLFPSLLPWALTIVWVVSDGQDSKWGRENPLFTISEAREHCGWGMETVLRKLTRQQTSPPIHAINMQTHNFSDSVTQGHSCLPFYAAVNLERREI